MAAKNSQPNSADAVSVIRLKNRADFLKARDGARSHERAFVLQLRERPNDEDQSLRVGFTVTKKIRNAVERNRIKRRLREAVRQADIPTTAAGKDAVLIGRRDALHVPFENLVSDVTHGLEHAKYQSKTRNRRKASKHSVAKPD